MKADDKSDWREIHLTPEQFLALLERLIEKYPIRRTTDFNQDLTKLDVIPLFHVLWDALAAEEYEACAEVKKEIEYRKQHKILCPLSVAVLKQSDYPLFGFVCLQTNVHRYSLSVLDFKHSKIVSYFSFFQSS